MARILYVEDEPSLRGTTVLGLKKAGHEVVAAEDGLTAQKEFDESQKPGGKLFDLVLTDWNYPDGGGEHLIKHIRGSGSQVPIVIASDDIKGVDRVKNQDPVLLHDVPMVLKPYVPFKKLSDAIDNKLGSGGNPPAPQPPGGGSAGGRSVPRAAPVL